MVTVCDHCGDIMEFRRIDGRNVPLHYCSKNFGDFISQLVEVENTQTYPTICQHCGAKVFFYQNSFGSKVFFEDVGWPWEKHACVGVFDERTKVSRHFFTETNIPKLAKFSFVSSEIERSAIKMQLAQMETNRKIEIRFSLSIVSGDDVESIKGSPIILIKANNKIECTVSYFSFRYGRVEDKVAQCGPWLRNFLNPKSRK